MQGSIDGFPLELRDTITVKNEKGGLDDDAIYGLLSPSAFAMNRLVVLDLKTPMLYLVSPVPKDIPKWLAEQFNPFVFDEIQRLPAAPYVETIKVKAGALGEIVMTVDSGATTTNIYSDLSPDKIRPFNLTFGKHTCTTNSARLRPMDSPGNRNHLLGMDCLRGKILAIPPAGNSSIWIGW